MYEYENMKRTVYDCGDELGIASFVPVCPHCGRFVKSDAHISVNYNGLIRQPNATCSKCGRVEMPFDGFFGDDEL